MLTIKYSNSRNESSSFSPGRISDAPSLPRNIRVLEHIASARPRKDDGWSRLCEELAQELIAACFDNPMAAMPLMPAEFNVDFLLVQYKERTTLASLAWNPSYDPKLERRLASIKCPTLVIWGANDRVIPPVYGDTFHRQIANSRLVKLEGTGHMPMFEKHEEWARSICEFLEQGKD